MFRGEHAGQRCLTYSESHERLDTRLIAIPLDNAGFMGYRLVHVLAVDATAEQGRFGGPLRAVAHNVRDPQLRRSKVQVVYNFGREDAASRDALQRLAASVTRFLDPGAALAAAAGGLEFTESRPAGGTWVLDALWSRLGIGPAMRKLLKGRRLDDSAERVLFALVANRALAPSCKLAAARWASEDVLLTGPD